MEPEIQVTQLNDLSPVLPPQRRVPISFEFFPPKTPDGAEKLVAVRKELYAAKPEFCSVTFGAGGSTQDGTVATIRQILAEGMSAAPHMSCIGTSKATIRDLLATYQAMGVKRIVALRGDLPSGSMGSTGGDFRFASDLVAFIRAETGDHFHIEVAAYPEVHPQAKSATADLQAYATKVKAGANSAMTQYFYNSDAYFRFVDDAYALGADVPVVPGIMPITNYTQLARFSDACGAEIPRWIRQRLIAYGDDLASIRAFGLDVTTDLCDQLITGGVPGLHLYSMNQSGAVLEVCRRLALGGV